MAIWQLDPIDSSDHNWRASTYVGRVIIRAPDEQRAREIATYALRIAAERIPGMEVPIVPIIPWAYGHLVECERIEAGTHKEDGEDAILEPSEYDDRWRR